jgi:dihydrodipicolinate synthase/N-acetylneuraminate lyase
MMGIIDADAVRRPLLPLDDRDRNTLRDVLHGAGLVEPTGGRQRGLGTEAVA